VKLPQLAGWSSSGHVLSTGGAGQGSGLGLLWQDILALPPMAGENYRITSSASLFMSLQVFIKHEGQKISLIVDGIGAQSKRMPGGDTTRITGPLYVGGVPSSLMVLCSVVYSLKIVENMLRNIL